MGGHFLFHRDEETGIATSQAAFSSIQDGIVSDDEEDEDDIFSDTQSHYEEFDVSDIWKWILYFSFPTLISW